MCRAGCLVGDRGTVLDMDFRRTEAVEEAEEWRVYSH